MRIQASNRAMHPLYMLASSTRKPSLFPSAISYLRATRTCTVDHLDLAWLKSLCQQQQPRAARNQPLITLQVVRRAAATTCYSRRAYLAAVCLSVWTLLTCLHQADETDKRRVVCVSAQGPHTCAYHGESWMANDSVDRGEQGRAWQKTRPRGRSAADDDGYARQLYSINCECTSRAAQQLNCGGDLARTPVHKSRPAT